MQSLPKALNGQLLLGSFHNEYLEQLLAKGLMESFRLAISFISIGRLFVSLLFWPMVVGIFIGLAQLFISSAYLELVNETPDQFQERIKTESPEVDWFRNYIYPAEPPAGDPRLCRWIEVNGAEQPPAGCQARPLDIYLRTSHPADYDAAPYLKFFRNSSHAIHLCRNCSGQIVIDASGDTVVSDVYSLLGMGVFALTESANREQVTDHFVQAKVASDRLKDLAGTVFLHPVGLKEPINMSEATKTMILITNTALLIIITLWLSLKGHRKVLDYFARNDALLPLVASCGKNNFYAALWIITLFRVAFFLLMTLPATIILYSRTLTNETLSVFVGDTTEFILWLMAILTSLCSLTIVASIAELKHRHSWISFTYRYIPILICLVGTVIWICSAFIPGPTSRAAQDFVSAVPILGISPVLLSPLIAVNFRILALHSALASLLVVCMLRFNSRWFAAHLEEI